MIKKILKYCLFLTILFNFLIISFIFINNFFNESFFYNLIEYKRLVLNFFFENDYYQQYLSLIYFLLISFNIPLTTLITMTMGAIYGPLETFFYLVIASPAGSTVALINNRFFLQDSKFIDKIKYKVKLSNIYFNYKTILLLKIFPILPFSWVNIVASTFKEIKISKFFLINLLGCPFNIILFSNLGKSLINFDVLKILYFTLIILIFLIIGFLIKKNYFKNK